MDTTIFHSIWTVVMLALFVGIVIWAWSGKRKQAFRDAANLPFSKEQYIRPPENSGDDNHG